MFVGHLAVAFAAKEVEPRAPLGALVAASYGLDLLWPFLLLAGVEVVRIDPGNTAVTPLDFVAYPWSHSLLMALVWGALVALVAGSVLRCRRTGIVIGAVVVSHWVLDFLTHRPDLPLWPGGPKVGLGIWESIPATLLVEGALLVVAVALYVRATEPRDAIGRWALVGLLAFAAPIWMIGPFSPPPPSAEAVRNVAFSLWLFPLWAAWIERHRSRPA